MKNTSAGRALLGSKEPALCQASKGGCSVQLAKIPGLLHCQLATVALRPWGR